MKFNDAVLGLVILIGGLAIMAVARGFPATHGQAYGPDLFPTLIGTGFALSGLGLMISGWRARATIPWSDLGSLEPARLVDAGLILVTILAFILLTNSLGFILTAGLSTYGLMVRFRGGHWVSQAIIVTIFIIATDWAFRTMLLVPLPQGHILPRMPW